MMGNVIYKPFKSIEEIKAKGEFFPKGRIVPRRICSVTPSRKQHTLTFNSNQWALPTKSGYLLFVEHNDGEFCSIMRFSSFSDVKGYGSPHLGRTHYIANDCGNEAALKIFNEIYLLKNFAIKKVMHSDIVDF